MLCDNFGLFCYFGSMYEKAKIHLQNSISLSTSNFEGPTLYSRKIFFWGGGGRGDSKHQNRK